MRDPAHIPWYGRMLLGIWITGVLWYIGLPLLIWALVISGFATIIWLLLLAIDTLSEWLDKK